MNHLFSRLDIILVEWLLVFAVLWRGGKTLDSIWLLALLAVIVTIHSSFQARNVKSAAESPRIIWSAGMLFLLCTIISYLRSSTFNYGLDEVLQTASLLLIFFWSVTLVKRSGESVISILRALTAAAFVACLIGIVVYVFQPVDRFVGSFFDYRFHTDYWPNAWAEFLLLVIPVTVLLFYRRSSKYWLLKSLSIGVLLGSLFLSFSRGAIISAVIQISIASAGLLWIKRLRLPWKIVIPSIAVTVLTSLIVFLSINNVRSHLHPVQSILKKATFTAEEGASSISERSQFWHQAIVLSKQHPLFGWGPYSFRFIQPALQTDVLATSDHPHNVVLKLAMERGMPAALLFLIIIGWVFVCAVRPLMISKGSTADEHGIMILALLTSIMGVLAHNMIDYNLQFIAIALPSTMLTGFIVAMTMRRVHTHTFFMKWTELIIAILLLIVTVREGAYLVISSLGRHEQRRGNSHAALQWYRDASDEWFSRDMLLSQADLQRSQNDYAGAQITAMRSLAINSFDGRAWRLLGDIQLQAKETALASESFSRAFAINKYNDLGPLHGMLAIAASTRNMRMADALHGETDMLLTKFVHAIKVNAHFIALSSNVEDLEKIADLLSSLYPNSAGRYQRMKGDVRMAAQKERSYLHARTPGILW